MLVACQKTFFFEIYFWFHLPYFSFTNIYLKWALIFYVRCALHRVTPRHIMMAIRNDEELDKMLEGIIIKQGGVLPNINPILVPRKTTKSKGTYNNTSSQEY